MPAQGRSASSHRKRAALPLALALTAPTLVLASCGDEDPASRASSIPYRGDVTPVRNAEEALASVFIPPFEDCRDPKPGETGSGPNGKVCTHVAINGCTEPGKYFPDYGRCEVVRTQRPFWEAPPYAEPDPNDPRLDDPAFMAELAWATEEVEACGCVCCHDSRSFGGKFGQWDIARGPIWIDTLSDSGLALFSGLADSSALGAFPAEQNHGFDRIQTGIPTSDTSRMKSFLQAEMARRAFTEEQARAVAPFGGPLYALTVTKPPACKIGESVSVTGSVHWLGGGKARYVYVPEEGTGNPGVPPNTDLPAGTIWRLDVLADQPALSSGILYGQTPDGTFQYLPDSTPAPALVRGQRYHLVVLDDPGLALANCEFTYGS